MVYCHTVPTWASAQTELSAHDQAESAAHLIMWHKYNAISKAAAQSKNFSLLVPAFASLRKDTTQLCEVSLKLNCR